MQTCDAISCKFNNNFRFRINTICNLQIKISILSVLRIELAGAENLIKKIFPPVNNVDNESSLHIQYIISFTTNITVIYNLFYAQV